MLLRGPVLRRKKIAVVGAGPVGCLSAIAFAKNGWDVEVYESRTDIRLPSSKVAAEQRSINLAISSRALAALKCIDAASAARILQTAIPMQGRMIHDLQGKVDRQIYDIDGQCINSMDRTVLNGALLDEISTFPTIRVFFGHKVKSVDFHAKTMTVRDLTGYKDVHVDFDFCIGADGSYSVVRRQLMRVVRMDYQQEYIPHEYIELKMPAAQDQDGNPSFPLDPGYLHIWPRHSFMLIALPNKDKTFTSTLFAPKAEFDRMETPEMTLTWFKSYFSDALSIIGEETILKDFTQNPRSPLISTKMKPYHYKDCAIILGDAAHSMVPFYGQGLNCGLEDVRILQTLFREEGVEPATDSSETRSEDFVDRQLARALQHYTDGRHQDLLAICDLAMDNFVEMRHSVTTPGYLFRKALDNFLFSLSSRANVSLASLVPLLSRVTFPPGEPSGWLPLYTMVTFRPDISYTTAKKVAARQTQILGAAATGVLTATILGVGWFIYLHRTERRG